MSEPAPKAPSLDDYCFEKTIGEGSYGRAILASDRATGELVVIKDIPLANLTPQEIEDVNRETKILSQLHHENIIAYKCSFIERNILHIIMEYADGGDLAQKITEAVHSNTPFEEEQILDWFVQLCLAVKHCHDRKILHRDLKTQNVFLMKDGRVKLGDFGIAKALDQTAQMLKTAIGTPYYLSPEICKGVEYDAKSDIWSLGVILYEMCTLKHPFDANNINALVRKIIDSKPAPISKEYSAKLRKLVEKLLKKNQKLRPNIKKVLEDQLLSSRIGKFMTEDARKAEFCHTTFHGLKAGEEPDVMPVDERAPLKSPKSSSRSKLPVRSASREKPAAKPSTAKPTGARGTARRSTAPRPVKTPMRQTKESITKQKNASVRADREAAAEARRKKEEEDRLRKEKDDAQRAALKKSQEERAAKRQMEKERMKEEARATKKKLAGLQAPFKSWKNKTQEPHPNEAEAQPKPSPPRPKSRPANDKDATGRPNFLKKKTDEEEMRVTEAIMEARKKKNQGNDEVESGGETVNVAPAEDDLPDVFNCGSYSDTESSDEMAQLAVLSQNLDAQAEDAQAEDESGDDDDINDQVNFAFQGKPLELPPGDDASRLQAAREFAINGLGREKYEAVMKLFREQGESDMPRDKAQKAMAKLVRSPEEQAYADLIQQLYFNESTFTRD